MHVFNTWLIANLLHPIILIVGGLVCDYWDWDDEILYSIFQLSVYSLVFSLPCLLIAACLMALLKKSALEPGAKFMIWLFLCTSLPVICFLVLIRIILNEWVLMEDLFFILPATVSVFITIVIRIKPFLFHINPSTETNQQ